MITVIDYGASNLRSVEKAFIYLGEDVEITSDIKKIERADKLILPGNGAFKDCITSLRSSGIDEAIAKFIDSGRYFLGVCVGMQLLADRSYEFGVTDGFSYIGGEVKAFKDFIKDKTLKIPHTGWNNVIFKKEHKLLDGIDNGSYFYFVHSFFFDLKESDYLLGSCKYDINFSAVVTKDNILGVQFHPEKSQKAGLKLLENFCRL